MTALHRIAFLGCCCRVIEPEARAEVRHLEEGIVIPAATLTELNEGARSLGIPALNVI